MGNPGVWCILRLPGREPNVAIDFTGTDSQSKEAGLGEAGHCLASPGGNYWPQLRGQAGPCPPRGDTAICGQVMPQPMAKLLRHPRAAAKQGWGEELQVCCGGRILNALLKAQKQNRGADEWAVCAPCAGNP